MALNLPINPDLQEASRLVFSRGIELGNIPVAEYPVRFQNRRLRLDWVWLDSATRHVAFAFEIEGSNVFGALASLEGCKNKFEMLRSEPHGKKSNCLLVLYQSRFDFRSNHLGDWIELPNQFLKIKGWLKSNSKVKIRVCLASDIESYGLKRR
jgi:hypothetical protein